MQNRNVPPEDAAAHDEVESETPAVASTSRDTAETPTRSSQRRQYKPPRQQQEQRLLMRPWLMKLADDGDIPGLEWIDKHPKTLLRIPWCHGSRSEWNQDHSVLFRAWAEHKGLYRDAEFIYLFIYSVHQPAMA